MKFWKLYTFFKSLFFILVNFVIKIFFYIDFIFFPKKNKVMKNNNLLKQFIINKEWVVLGNAPSVDEKILISMQGKNIIAFNRAYLMNSYKTILPKFHIIIDDKFYKGEWNNDMIYKIQKLNPNVIFIFNAKWLKDKIFLKKVHQLTKNKIFWLDTRLFLNSINMNFYKIDLTGPTYGGGVFGVALSMLLYGKAKSVMFYGIEANGLCYELVNQKSHVYGHNPENFNKNTLNYVLDLDTMSITINNYFYFSKIYQKENIKITNCTTGGILDMFQRKKIEDYLN